MKREIWLRLQHQVPQHNIILKLGNLYKIRETPLKKDPISKINFEITEYCIDLKIALIKEIALKSVLRVVEIQHIELSQTEKIPIFSSKRSSKYRQI